MTNRSLRGQRVLVVEDEWMISILIEDMLNAMGCKVVAVAATLDEALENAQAPGIDLAVLDLNLGGKRSYAAADALAARGVPFVFATGYGEAALPERFAGTPAISKPFQRRDLEQAFERALGAARRNHSD